MFASNPHDLREVLPFEPQRISLVQEEQEEPGLAE